MHFGFIGTDWYRYGRGPLARCVRPLLRNISFYTATGESMRAEMIGAGFERRRIAVLPHCIDIERYPPGDPDRADYACVFVGQLIRRKRVAVILEAFAAVLQTHPGEKLCVVGDGPRRPALERLAGVLGIRDSVDFVGYIQDVPAYLRRAKLNVIASRREGFPFSLVEGICCGTVPISTPVGTIADFIRDGENGLLFPQNDAGALAGCIRQLLDDDALYNRMRENVLGMRNDFSYDHATEVWDRWFSKLGEQRES